MTSRGNQKGNQNHDNECIGLAKGTPNSDRNHEQDRGQAIDRGSISTESIKPSKLWESMYSTMVSITRQDTEGGE